MAAGNNSTASKQGGLRPQAEPADLLYGNTKRGHHSGMPNYRRLYIPSGIYFFTVKMRDWPFSTWHEWKKEYGRPINVPPEDWRPLHLGES